MIDYSNIKDFKVLTDEQLTYPKSYHQPDLPWIMSEMDRLTMAQRIEASDKYDKVKFQYWREKANGWLKNYIDTNGSAKPKERNQMVSNAVNPYQDRVDKLRKQPRGGRKSILDMADNNQ